MADLVFGCTGARAERYSATPALSFALPARAMAQNAIGSFVVLASDRIAEAPDAPGSQKLSMLLMG